MLRNESLKMAGHGVDISRHQHATGVRRDLKNFRIRSTVRDHASSATKIDGRFPSPQASSDFRIQIGVGLETKAQAGFTDFSLFARSKRSIISGVRGLRALNSS